MKIERRDARLGFDADQYVTYMEEGNLNERDAHDEACPL